MRNAKCQLRNEIKSDVISNEQRGGNVRRGEEKAYQIGMKRMEGEKRKEFGVRNAYCGIYWEMRSVAHIPYFLFDQLLIVEAIINFSFWCIMIYCHFYKIINSNSTFRIPQ